jgi:hypothetical protein
MERNAVKTSLREQIESLKRSDVFYNTAITDVLDILDRHTDGNRPLRAKVLEWAQSEDNQTQRESGIGLGAIIEAMDAQTAAIIEAIGFAGGAMQR